MFSTRMRHLAWGAEQGGGSVLDSDGDGVLDSDEIAAGTDPYDSEDS